MHRDGLGLRRGGLALVHAGVLVVDVADDQAGDGPTTGVLQQERLLRRLRAVEQNNLEERNKV